MADAYSEKKPRGFLRDYTAPAAALLILAALIFAARLHTYHEPYDRDITTYAVIAHEMINGRLLYTDLWDHKPPSIYLTYAAAELAAGYGRDAVFLLNILAALATLAGVYFAARAVGGGPAAAFWAAVFWAAVSGSFRLQANQPNSEVFINALMVWAFALAASTRSDRGGAARFIAAGLLLAAASTYKQVAVVGALALCCCHLYYAEDRRRAIGHVLLVGVTGAAVWAAVFAYFKAAGRFDDFYRIVFEYNSHYVGSIAKDIAWAAGPGIIKLFDVIRSIAILPALGLAGLAVGFREHKRQWIWIAAFTAACYIEVAMQGRFFNHYYQLLLPIFCVAAGCAVAEFGRSITTFSPKAVAQAGGYALLLLLCFEMPVYLKPAVEWSRARYGEEFIESMRIGGEINDVLAPDESFYEWGPETGLYFASGRSPQSGVFLVRALLDGPYKDDLNRRVIRDLETKPPELFIVNPKYPREGPVYEWFESRYAPYPGPPEPGTFELYALRGGRLLSGKP